MESALFLHWRPQPKPDCNGLDSWSKGLTVNKTAEFGSGRQEVEKTREEVYRCRENRHKVNWCGIRGCRES